jgi:hypothetical protein
MRPNLATDFVMSKINYRYALNELGITVDSFTLNSSERKGFSKFSCLGCGNELIAILGKQVTKHFRHRVDINTQCSGETYLHKLGKQTFLDTYKSCLVNGLPYWIEYPAKEICIAYQSECDRGFHAKEFDLTKYFDRVELEVRDDFFTPDLLLSNGKEKLYIEIVVSHQSSQEKIDSGTRIIEIYIYDEGSIEIIKSCKLSRKYQHTEFINFKNLFKDNYCSGACNVPKTVLLEYPGKKFSIETLTRAELDKNPGTILVEGMSHYQLLETVDNAVWAIFDSGNREFKNCILCVHRGDEDRCPYIRISLINDSSGREKEDILSVSECSTFAPECDSYRPLDSLYVEPVVFDTKIKASFIHVTFMDVAFPKARSIRVHVYRLRCWHKGEPTYDSDEDNNRVEMIGGSREELKRRLSKMFGVDMSRIKSH